MVDKKQLEVGFVLTYKNKSQWRIKDIYPNAIVVGTGATDMVAVPDRNLKDFQLVAN